MFFQIFLFELKYRIQRPGPWLCFLLILGISIIAFTFGHLPVSDKEFINAPAVLAFFMAASSMPMMLISSAIMGVPLYRDIEYNTKEYYLSYPISRAGYFYGRFCGSLLILLIIGAAVPFGAWLGSTIGKASAWREAGRYGPQHLIYYLHPYLTIALPNMIFTSCLFFGLVAATRNIKVIYSSGLILFMGYLIASFALQHTNNRTVIDLCDPFAIGPVHLEIDGMTLTQKNNSLISIHDAFLINRLAWPAVGLIVLLAVYARFSFEKFFSGRADKKAIAPGITDPSSAPRDRSTAAAQVSFTGEYHRRTLFTLTRIELLNIIRDNYFWIILSCGTIFMSLIFWNIGGRYGIPDLRRTFLMIIGFNENFLFFVFIVLIFYTGETIHREKLTRYASINDSLPPPNWVLNCAKLFSLLCLAFFLAVFPILIGIGVQLSQGFTHLDLPLYGTNFLAVDLPLFVEMVFFAYMLHVVINNKFAALGIGIGLWIAIALLRDSGKLDYLLFLYSNTPNFLLTEIDGLGPMAKPLFWFHLYWLFCGGLFLVLAALFYNRGVMASFRERLQLAKERWGIKTRMTAFLLLAGFLAAGSFIYYNLSYLNNYLTRSESIERKAIYERQLKHYDGLPLPSTLKIRMVADLFPAERRALVHAYVTLINRTTLPIDSFLLDGDNIDEYSLRQNGKLLDYTCPLIYDRGKFDLFRPSRDTAEFRLYRLPQTLAPGQEMELELNSKEEYTGFANSFLGATFLHNFLFFSGGMPGLGYDEGDELGQHDDRMKYHLPEKKPEPIPHGDPRGVDKLLDGDPAGLYSMDITVSTSEDQVIVSPGTLLGEWHAAGRHYYHFAQNKPGMYFNFGLYSGKYQILHDSAMTEGGRIVPISIYYFRDNDANLDRFLFACKDGLRYYSHVFGPYPFDRLILLESPAYAPDGLKLPGLLVYSENFGWNAMITDPDQFDFPYHVTVRDLAGQWWGQQLAPNNTIGSQDISEGVSAYSALIEEQGQKGMNAFRAAQESEIGGYYWGQRTGRRIHETLAENPLLTADRQYVWEHKTALNLYGLSDLIGADSLNAALREFHEAWAFRAAAPFAGSDDLYRVLQRHVPDSFRYYLEDGWEKNCLYQNKMIRASAVPQGKDGKTSMDGKGSNDSAYRVTLRVSVGKKYTDSAGVDHPAEKIDDYIDIGIFSADTRDRAGMKQMNPLWLEKRRLGPGEHILTVIVHGKPASAAIDPYRLLMEEKPQDDWKAVALP
jgi:ABC-2 type transport system permease protein